MAPRLWASCVNRYLKELNKLDLGYPLGTNTVYSPRPVNEVTDLLVSLGLGNVGSMREFYASCDGVSLPDVHVGYFIKPIAELTDSVPDSEPIKITGDYAGEVQTFGSTGGGGLFVLGKQHLDVLYLPPGPLLNGIYDGIRAHPKRIALGLPAFLDVLLADIIAFVTGIRDHTFIA